MKCEICGKRETSDKNMRSYYGPNGGKLKWAHKTCKPEGEERTPWQIRNLLRKPKVEPEVPEQTPTAVTPAEEIVPMDQVSRSTASSGNSSGAAASSKSSKPKAKKASASKGSSATSASKAKAKPKPKKPAKTTKKAKGDQ